MGRGQGPPRAQRYALGGPTAYHLEKLITAKPKEKKAKKVVPLRRKSS
jgi:hypothetical protein